MATLQPAVIKFYADTAGFSADEAKIAAAIALAESGGNPRAHNNTGRDDSYGLWQINYYGDLKADRTKAFGPGEGLYDPAKNAKAAYAIYKGSGWAAWTTYTSGAYKAHLSKVDGAALGNTIPENAAADAKDVKESLDIAGPINALGSSLFKAGSNFAGVTVAIALVVLGIVILMRSQITNLVPVKGIAKKVLK